MYVPKPPVDRMTLLLVVITFLENGFVVRIMGNAKTEILGSKLDGSGRDLSDCYSYCHSLFDGPSSYLAVLQTFVWSVDN